MRRLALLLVTGLLAGCADAFFFEPAIGAGGAHVALTVDASQLAGSPADAFDRTDRIRIALVDPGSSETVFVEERDFAPGGSVTRVRVEVELQGSAGTLALGVQLSGSGEILFVGGGTVDLQPGQTTEAPVSLEPVPAAVVASPVADFTAYGQTRALSAAVVMATGDTIPGERAIWTSANPLVVAVQEGAGTNPRGVAVADGSTELVARWVGEVGSIPLALEDRVPARVRAEVVRVVVDPPSLVLDLDGTGQLAATPFDALGNPIAGRTATWRSVDENVVTVDAQGLVTPVEPGETSVVATVEGVEGAASVLVDEPEPPATPTGLSVGYLGGVRLTWTDQSGGTAATEILRRVTPVSAPPARQVAFEPIAVVPPGTTSFTDPEPVPGLLEYAVRSCNAFACSSSTIPVGFGYQVPPGAFTQPAELLAGGPLRLRALVDPNGLDTEAWFEVDFSPAFTDPGQTNMIPAGAGYEFVSVTYEDSGASPGFTYYIRVVAQNSAGVTVGNTVEITIPEGLSASPRSPGGGR